MVGLGDRGRACTVPTETPFSRKAGIDASGTVTSPVLRLVSSAGIPKASCFLALSSWAARCQKGEHSETETDLSPGAEGEFAGMAGAGAVAGGGGGFHSRHLLELNNVASAKKKKTAPSRSDFG